MADVLHEFVMIVHMFAICGKAHGILWVIMLLCKVNVVLPEVICRTTLFSKIAGARFTVVMISTAAWRSFFRY